MKSGLQTAQMEHAVDNICTVLMCAFARLRTQHLSVEDQHPASLLMLMLDEGLKGLGYSGLTTHQRRLRLYFVDELVNKLLRVVRAPPQEWIVSDQDEKTYAAMLSGDFSFDPGRLRQLRERYRSSAQLEHGTIINPVLPTLLLHLLYTHSHSAEYPLSSNIILVISRSRLLGRLLTS